MTIHICRKGLVRFRRNLETSYWIVIKVWETYVWGGVLGGVLRKVRGFFEWFSYQVPLVDCRLANLESVPSSRKSEGFANRPELLMCLFRRLKSLSRMVIFLSSITKIVGWWRLTFLVQRYIKSAPIFPTCRKPILMALQLIKRDAFQNQRIWLTSLNWKPTAVLPRMKQRWR